MRRFGGRAEDVLYPTRKNIKAKVYLYAIHLNANEVLQRHIEPLLTRPVGHPSNEPVVWHARFLYQGDSRDRPRRVVAKIEHHKGEFFPGVGFIVTNLRRPYWQVVKFYSGRGTAQPVQPGTSFTL